MSTITLGRHRAPGRINPVVSLSSAVVRGARPAMTVTATFVAAGGMVAGLVTTANAVPLDPATATATAVAADTVVLSGGPVAKVAYGEPVISGTTTLSSAPAFATVALSARTQAAASVRTTARPQPANVRPAAASSSSRATAASPARIAAAAAYAPKKATVPNRAPATGVLGIAASLSGIPYSWGGTSPAGFDCSGFTQYVFRQAGISLPRTAGGQRAASRSVSNPQPGDLVFFGTWHVGIYAGNGMMYDSPTSGQTTGLHRIWSSAVSYGRVG